MTACKISFLHFIVFCLLCSLSQAQYGGGTGTQDDPFLISSSEQMNVIGTEPLHWDKHFRLMADVDLSQYAGEQFNMIGSVDQPFCGVFDGNGHDIANFTYRCLKKDYVGLFRYVQGESAEIRDLSMTDPNVMLGSAVWTPFSYYYLSADETSYYTAALVAYLDEGVIRNCRVLNGNIQGLHSAGGLVGLSSNQTTITNCHSFASVSANSSVGGLAGSNAGRIYRCYTMGRITGIGGIGGLAGTNSGLIDTCYSHCSVDDYGVTASVGGLVGFNSFGQILKCYASGSVGGPEGALIGLCQAGQSVDSYWNAEVRKDNHSFCSGSPGKTFSEMKQRATYVNWDFETVWDIAENRTFPFFRDTVPGDLNGDHLVDYDDLLILMEHWTQDSKFFD